MKKTLKLAAKRLKITKRSKILRRLSQQGHFKSKENGNIRRAKRKPTQKTSTILTKILKKTK